jgi:hypothetical protein
MKYVLYYLADDLGFIVFNTGYQSLPDFKDVFGFLALGIIFFSI